MNNDYTQNCQITASGTDIYSVECYNPLEVYQIYFIDFLFFLIPIILVIAIVIWRTKK